VGEEDAAGLLAKIGPPLKATRTVRDGQTLDVAGATVKVIGTPGHTPGSVSYLLEGRFLFTGDTLRLRRGEVLPFLPCFNSDQRALDRSIRRLARLDGTEWLMTAHSGATGNWDKAFRRWREASFGGSSPGGCPA
jgi:glyoxylase-like metal-dependent hydrolase (beta-lactamase superfamily II)